ncbi:unnamed protein product [Rotaria magnacalcarata]|uniref:Uncharacterized protein n=3 Tax=Rotaria magnacalcarata TaxID=392030 RepID=A0A819FCJ2_9BILA|nr:unnamed protein product [Rotaria magnacalcarata]CAF3866356.1 unnamed protein product [Rotaria magnacalcarata]
MMNEDFDDEDDVILDRQKLSHNINSASSNFDLNQSNFELDDDSNTLSKEKTVILALTCISIGMFTGLLGPTFSYLEQKLSTKLSSIVWLIAVKAIGFLIGTCLSSCLYTWFNVCCLLGLSCLSISFGVCSLPFITDLTTFYLTSLILGIALGLSYSGIDGLYNRVWPQPTVSSIRWLHLLIALGAILSTLMLLPSTFSTDKDTSSIINTTQSLRPHREIFNNNTELLFNLSTSKSICLDSFCCYDQNNRNQTFICQESDRNNSIDCQNILSSCRTALLNICNMPCRIDRICTSNCSIEFMSPTTNKSSIIPVTVSQTSTSHHNKPQTAESDNDDLSQNYFYLKIRSSLHSITLIDLIYLFISLLFFLLAITYSIFAMKGETMGLLSMANLNPLSLLFIQPHRIVNNSNRQISLLSDRSSIKFVFLLVLFYFTLSGIENSCTYLTYLFGRRIQLSERNSLVFQICYLCGRLIDILINHTWFLVNKYLKKQSELISIKSLIFFRLLILFLICVSSLFHKILYYFVFFSIGFFLTSLPSLILYWIERDLSLNELLLRVILYTMLISEIMFPVIIFYKIEYFLQYYLLIGLCLLMILFIMMLYSSKKWQRNRLYRLLPTSMELDGVDAENDTDNEA